MDEHGGIVGMDGLPMGTHGGVRPGVSGGMGIRVPKGMIVGLVKEVLSDLKILEQLAIIDARTKAIISHLGIPEPELSVEEPEEETAQGE